MKDLSLRKDPTNPNYIPFTSVHTISTGDWTEAYRWSRDTNKQLRLTGDAYIAVAKDIATDLTDERAARLAAQFTDFNFDAFDEYTAASNSVQKMVLEQRATTAPAKSTPRNLLAFTRSGSAPSRDHGATGRSTRDSPRTTEEEREEGQSSRSVDVHRVRHKIPCPLVKSDPLGSPVDPCSKMMWQWIG